MERDICIALGVTCHRVLVYLPELVPYNRFSMEGQPLNRGKRYIMTSSKQDRGGRRLTKSKWLMKQYWRIGSIRTLLALAFGMLTLGRFYSPYVPILDSLGLIGALVLAVILIFVFLIIGWAYDERARLWKESVQVGLERNPYSYVPDFRALAIDYPAAYVIFDTLHRLFKKLNLPAETILDLSVYLDDFFRRNPENKDDLFSAEELAEEFLEQHPFNRPRKASNKEASLGAKAKKRFQLEVLRVNYIQSFSGLAQDVLIFGALFVTLLYPNVVVSTPYGDLVPLDYLLRGILMLSVPMYVGMAIAGWYYDRKLVLWSPEQIVNIERNPYSYVPEPRNYALLLPIYHTFFAVLRELFVSHDMDTIVIDRLALYLHEYLQLSVTRNEDLFEAQRLRSELGAVFEPLDERLETVRG